MPNTSCTLISSTKPRAGALQRQRKSDLETETCHAVGDPLGPALELKQETSGSSQALPLPPLMGDTKDNITTIVEDATFDFTMGDAEEGIEKLKSALESHPDAFEAWHALCEIFYSEKRYDEALEAAEKAHALKPNDLFVNTSLSRIWLEKGSKEKAEHFGAQARMADWKNQLTNPAAADSGSDLV